MFLLKPGLSLRSVYLSHFLLLLHRKALTLLRYIEDETYVQQFRACYLPPQIYLRYTHPCTLHTVQSTNMRFIKFRNEKQNESQFLNICLQTLTLLFYGFEFIWPQDQFEMMVLWKKIILQLKLLSQQIYRLILSDVLITVLLLIIGRRGKNLSNLYAIWKLIWT